MFPTRAVFAVYRLALVPLVCVAVHSHLTQTSIVPNDLLTLVFTQTLFTCAALLEVLRLLVHRIGVL